MVQLPVIRDRPVFRVRFVANIIIATEFFWQANLAKGILDEKGKMKKCQSKNL